MDWRDINPEFEIRKEAYEIYQNRIRQINAHECEICTNSDWIRARLELGLHPVFVSYAAYFIWKNRVARGVPGNQDGDTLVAEKMIIYDTLQARKKKEREETRHRAEKEAAGQAQSIRRTFG